MLVAQSKYASRYAGNQVLCQPGVLVAIPHGDVAHMLPFDMDHNMYITHARSTASRGHVRRSPKGWQDTALVGCRLAVGRLILMDPAQCRRAAPCACQTCLGRTTVAIIHCTRIGVECSYPCYSNKTSAPIKRHAPNGQFVLSASAAEP